METKAEQQTQWFVMRDLKRSNAKLRAYQQLADEGFQVFTPTTTKIVDTFGKRRRIQVPFIPDLLFVNAPKASLDKFVTRIGTLQYRYIKDAPYGTSMTVSDVAMDRFIAAVSSVKTPKYYSADEITPDMYGSIVRIIGDSALSGYEGRLLKVRGASKKRLLVDLSGLLCASIEINSSYFIEFL